MNLATMKDGILPSQLIENMRDAGMIRADATVENIQIQPASLDLRLGKTAYRVRASFLPGPEQTVTDRLEDLALHEFSLERGAVLETGCVYIVPLLESLKLPQEISAAANPKSSTGRLDVFTRVICDGNRQFDNIPAGYEGPLYAEICPQTFPVLVRTGSRLSQIRFRKGAMVDSDAIIQKLHAEEKLVNETRADIMGGIAVSVDLSGEGSNALIGYRAKRHAAVVDVDRPNTYPQKSFWEPIYSEGSSGLILDPDQFYILASKESVKVPPQYAAEMVPFDPLVGEFRVHYAGFFDPGFGHDATGGQGSRGVLEVRSHNVPFILEHGQIIARLRYEPLCEMPERVYGSGIGSNYQAQGLKLSKHFIMDDQK